GAAGGQPFFRIHVSAGQIRSQQACLYRALQPRPGHGGEYVSRPVVVGDLRHRHRGRQRLYQTQTGGSVDRFSLRLHGVAQRRTLAAMEAADLLGGNLSGTADNLAVDLLVGAGARNQRGGGMESKPQKSNSGGGRTPSVAVDIEDDKPSEHHMIPVWFFVGVILLAYGLIIT